MTKIMIVDDEKGATDLLEKLLKHKGYESISVNDSTKAIEVAHSYNPDIFLLDLMMPVIDGFKLCMLLREDPQFTTTPIIIITALCDDDSRVVAFGAGADDYLTKPYVINDLELRISKLIQ
jgi:two-component system, OmpR family, alkaline phosphatase synthesis response regulator PhoP